MDQNSPLETQVSLQDVSVNQTLSAQTQFPWKYLSFGLIFIILAGTGVFFVGKNTVKTQNQVTLTSVTTPTNAPTITEPNTSVDLIPFQNQFGYTIQHGSSVKIVSQGQNIDGDPTKNSAITIFSEKIATDVMPKNPYMQIVVFDANQTHYQETELGEIAAANFKENTENKNNPVGIIKPLSETIFQKNKAYSYSFKCRGFSGIYESTLGVDGTCRMIFTEHKGKFFFIGYYEIPVFEAIVKNFTFE